MNPVTNSHQSERGIANESSSPAEGSSSPTRSGGRPPRGRRAGSYGGSPAGAEDAPGVVRGAAAGSETGTGAPGARPRGGSPPDRGGGIVVRMHVGSPGAEILAGLLAFLIGGVPFGWL